MLELAPFVHILFLVASSSPLLLPSFLLFLFLHSTGLRPLRQLALRGNRRRLVNLILLPANSNTKPTPDSCHRAIYTVVWLIPLPGPVLVTSRLALLQLHNRVETPGAIATLPCADSPRLDSIRAESQIPQNRIDDEVSRLREEHTRIKERRNILLQL